MLKRPYKRYILATLKITLYKRFYLKLAKNSNLEKIHKVNFGKIFQNFWKNGEQDTPFFENFPKEIHQIANFGSVSYRGPHQNHLFFPSVSYKGRFL